MWQYAYYSTRPAVTKLYEEQCQVKRLLVSKIASSFYCGFASESIQRHSLIANLTAANETLAGRQHLARELPVDQA